jgi:ElaB/YqjD/DUF883 family membrane-anchored ribosome-binding protein
MPQSNTLAAESRSSPRETVADATLADVAVQKASKAYDTAKRTVEERPFLTGALAAAAIGFMLGAVWKLGSRRSPTDQARDRLGKYADFRSLRNAGWW